MLAMTNRILVFSLAVSCVFPSCLHARPKQKSGQAYEICREEKNALASGAYGYAVMDHMWPSAFPVGRGITVAVQFRPEAKVLLHTDGTKFTLWMGTAQVPGNNLWEFLGDLADSCRLPPDPADAVKLLNMKWDVVDLQKKQFEQLHGEFMTALTDYVSTIRERASYFMATTRMGGGVDASVYTIVYDNSWQHIKIDEWDLPINGQITAMMKWVREFRSVAEGDFHVNLQRGGAPSD
jgi:hypothetical protein